MNLITMKTLKVLPYIFQNISFHNFYNFNSTLITLLFIVKPQRWPSQALMNSKPLF